MTGDLSLGDPVVTAPRLLDPFEFHGYTASVITGIGGKTPNTDPSYAFHSCYVPVARGHAHFTIRFVNLRAKLGTLVLRVHMLSSVPGSVARMVTSERIQLNRLVHRGGEVTVRFEAFRNMTYAIMGLVAGETDAGADDVIITLDRPFDPAASDDQLDMEFEDSRFGREDIRGSKYLVSAEPPSLARPGSQAATVSQLKTPEYEAWAKRLGAKTRNPLEIWGYAYVSQILAVYRLMGEGANGLVLGSVDPVWLQWARQEGVNLSLVSDASPEEALAAPDCDYRQIDLEYPPEDLVNFDFVCSFTACAQLDDAVAAVRLIERSLDMLRPSGFGIHVFGTGASSPHLDRIAIERTALTLISRGHQVAQLHPIMSLEAASHAGAFGLLVRKARSIL